MGSKKIVERLSEIKAYIFDLDGTLINSEQVMAEITLGILTSYGIEDGRDYLNRVRGRNMDRVRAAFIEKYTHKLDYNSYIKCFSDQLTDRLHSGQVHLMPGAGEVLDLTRSLGKRALATSTSKDLAEEKLAYTPVGQAGSGPIGFVRLQLHGGDYSSFERSSRLMKG